MTLRNKTSDSRETSVNKKLNYNGTIFLSEINLDLIRNCFTSKRID